MHHVAIPTVLCPGHRNVPAFLKGPYVTKFLKMEGDVVWNTRILSCPHTSGHDYDSITKTRIEGAVIRLY